MIQFESVNKSYKTGKVTNKILTNVNLQISGSKVVCISGPSGSGKSTLLNVMAGLDAPDSGQVKYDNNNIYKYNEKKMELFRKKVIGFVFQAYHLIPNLTAYENIMLAAELVEDPLPIEEILEFVHLTDKRSQYPDTLSGGEQQRVAIARAIIKNPQVLLCDEPTGALDSKSGLAVLELLQRLKNKFNKTIIIVTHNSSIVKMADEVIWLKDGIIVRTQNNNPIKPSEVIW